MAGQQFSCGPARVVVATELNNDRTKDFDYAGVLTVETQGHQTVLQYRENVDFLGAACVFDARFAPDPDVTTSIIGGSSTPVRFA